MLPLFVVRTMLPNVAHGSNNEGLNNGPHWERETDYYLRVKLNIDFIISDIFMHDVGCKV